MALSASNLCASFKKSGIHPLNPRAFDQNKIIPNVVFQHKSFESNQNDISNTDTEISDTEIDKFISNIEVGVTALKQTKQIATLSVKCKIPNSLQIK